MAEVLITLGIIGIVSAMTLPALIAKYQKFKTLVVLKKAYSETQTFLMDFKTGSGCDGDFDDCFPASGQVRDDFANYLYTKKRFYDKYANQSGNVIIQRSSLDGKLATLSYKPIKVPGSHPRLLIAPNGLYALEININQRDLYYQLKGKGKPNYFRAMISIYTAPAKIHSADYSEIISATIKNINNNPIIGKDVFTFFVMSNGEIIPNGSSKCKNIYGSWAYYCNDWESGLTCNPEQASTSGAGCLSRIIENGWQIKYKW